MAQNPAVQGVERLHVVRLDLAVRQRDAESVLNKHDQAHDAHAVQAGFEQIVVVAEALRFGDKYQFTENKLA